MTLEAGGREAQERIAQLESELAALRSQDADRRFVAGLRARLAEAAAASGLSAPADNSPLLRELVQTAVAALRAGAGSLYLLDEKAEELVFEVALGPAAEPLAGRRLPLGSGIAGWVAATGQAIAVADVDRDPRWARDVAEEIGYTPRTMAAAPLIARERTIGVLQLLDKEGGAPFSAEDLTLLGQFAEQAAAAVAQSWQLRSVSLLLDSALRDLLGTDAAGPLMAEADAFVARLEGSPGYAQTMQLATMLGELAGRNDDALELCLDVIGAIASYLQRRERYA